MSRQTRKVSNLLLILSLAGTSMVAQIVPHAALKNFKLPKYNENSFRAYTLSGAEGIYDPDGSFTIRQAVVSVYSGDNTQALQTTIRSDHAIIDLKQDRASSDAIIEVVDTDFYLRGRGWTLDMSNRQITIESEGYLRFNESMEMDLSAIF